MVALDLAALLLPYVSGTYILKGGKYVEAGEYLDEAVDAVKSKKYKEVATPINQGRMDLAGKHHPVSGVMFDLNGFPIFDAKYTMELQPEDYMKSRATHFSKASKALYDDIMKDNNLRSKFTETEIELFKHGKVPNKYTWHHHQETGVLQLVDREVHRKTGHTGGFTIWGSGD